MKTGGEKGVNTRSVRDAVAQVWAEVLGRENVGPNDNFFDLGGDSLKALEVISRLHALIGIELPLIAFFEDPTIAHLAHVLAGLQLAIAAPSNGTGTSLKDNARATVTQVWSEILQRQNISPIKPAWMILLRRQNQKIK